MRENNLPTENRPLVADAALCRSDVQFRHLLDKLPAGAYTCDAEGLITYFNQHAAQLWGRVPRLNDPVDRFCGSFKLFSTDGLPINRDECWMALALQHNAEYNGHEVVIERPDGQRVIALAHANPIRDEAGMLLGAVNVLVDITDRKNAEIALREADRRKNEFLATLAHELRNPLAPIRNAAEILHLKAEPAPELHWALAVIGRQLQQMTRLIDDLLDLARVTNNKMQLRKERLQLAEVVHTAVETSRPLIEACGQELVLSLPSQTLFLEGDLTRLAQVIANLLNNAAKYSERDGRIQLQAERQGSDVVVTVRDTGIGIAADVLPHIFEMFTQGSRALPRSQGGLGIGLTLVKQLVAMHGGTITAHSAGPGKGSEFVVRLPVLMEPPATLERNTDPSPRAAAGAAFRILVVDDNPDTAATLGMLLRITGRDVRTAQDGLEALAKAEQFRPHVVLLDIGLPKLNGYETAERIRQQPWGKTMVLIATTGWGQSSERQRSREAGFDHHLVKPVDTNALSQLLSSLEEVVFQRAGNREADSHCWN
jgi:signal transduction histidine kinase/CheY-like chemotaxis protein